MKTPFIYAFTGFFLAALFAVAGDWTLQEFCWSTWLAGLTYIAFCVISGGLHTIISGGSLKARAEVHIPRIASISPAAFTAIITVLVLVLTPAILYIYAFLFSIYGMLLSFFAEMEPHELFGRNGFINSGFFTPVGYLLIAFWPMALGTLIANWRDFIQDQPWKRMFVPTESELIRVHVMVVVMPFIALLAWALLGEAYHSVAIVLLMAVFYLFTKIRDRTEVEGIG
jgi:hypothetical protein